MIYLRDSKKWPLQMILREILINDAAGGISDDADAQYLQELIKYCTIIVATVPILCIYPFVQKYFMKGVMLTHIHVSGTSNGTSSSAITGRGFSFLILPALMSACFSA